MTKIFLLILNNNYHYLNKINIILNDLFINQFKTNRRKIKFYNNIFINFFYFLKLMFKNIFIMIDEIECMKNI